MKKYFAALSATALISVAPFAMASSTDLTVTGTIMPSACTPNISNGGLVEIGKLEVKDLSPTAYSRVGQHDLKLTVACTAERTFALSVIDNRAGTQAVGNWFGMGLTKAGERLGTINVEVRNTLADAVPARAIFSADNGTTWAPIQWPAHNQLLSVASTADTSVRIPVTDLEMDLRIYSNIAPTNGLTLNEDVDIDGSATFEIKYD